jgi:hypothetical protein
MVVTCPTCQRTYDDTHKWTICPHNLLEAGPHAPRGTREGYCAQHDLYYCKLPHDP